MDKDAFYFPHFSNARNDRKLKRIRKQLGIEGYGIFFMILEVLRETSNFSYPIDDIDLLADDFGTSEEKINVIIRAPGLFDIDGDNFFSPKFNLFLQPYLLRKEQARLAGIESGKQRRLNSSSTSVQRELNSSPTRVEQIKESKVKKTKVNKYTSDTQEYTLVDNFLNNIISLKPDFKKPDIQKWCESMNLMIRLDKRSIKDIQSVIDFIKSDTFWFKTCLSIDSMRKNFDKLHLGSKDNDYKIPFEKKESKPEIDDCVKNIVAKLGGKYACEIKNKCKLAYNGDCLELQAINIIKDQKGL